MKITPEELKAVYHGMSDEELLAMNPDELTDVARAVYDKELEDRGLNFEVPADESSPAEAAAEELWTAAGTYESADEAWRMHAVLESANIPSRIHNRERRGVQTRGFEVQVPASYLDDAHSLLGSSEPDAFIVPARYENGVFKPLEEVEIQEGTLVEVHVPAGSMTGEDQ